MTCSLIDSRLVCARPVEDFHQTRKDSRIQREVAGARGRAQVIHDILLPEVQPRPHSEPDNLLAQDHSVAWAARPMTEANRPESVVVMVMMGGGRNRGTINEHLLHKWSCKEQCKHEEALQE